MAAGFVFRYRKSGGAPTIKNILAKNTATYTRGDLLNLVTGQLDLGATGNSDFLGVCLQTIAATAAVTKVQVIVDSDAVYGVADANARTQGVTLDIAGATGAQGVAASSNKEFTVEATKTSAQETLVSWNTGKHFDNKAH